MVVSMAQVEGMAVQLSEARRLATHPDVHHQRLALLMLDNASEVSLRRSADAVLAQASMYNSAKRQLGQIPSPSPDLEAFLAEIEPLTVSQTTMKRIDRLYDPLVDFVAERAPNSLSSEHAACLKVLHRFRNAAYHRDKVRPDVLAPAVNIMLFLCCHLLKNEAPGYMHELGETPAFIQQLLQGPVGDHEDFPGTGDAITLSRRVADAFLADLELDHSSINTALSRHLSRRLDQLDLDLDEIESLGPRSRRDLTLRIVQQAPETAEEAAAPIPADFWTRPLDVTVETLLEWRGRVDELAANDDARSALRVFAEIEKSLEKLEEPVARFIRDIERERELKSDR